MQFLLKWGMTSSTFRKVFTYKGKDFKSQKIGTFKTGNRFKISLIRGRLKAIFYLLTKDFGPLWKFWKKHLSNISLKEQNYKIELELSCEE